MRGKGGKAPKRRASSAAASSGGPPEAAGEDGDASFSEGEVALMESATEVTAAQFLVNATDLTRSDAEVAVLNLPMAYAASLRREARLKAEFAENEAQQMAKERARNAQIDDQRREAIDSYRESCEKLSELSRREKEVDEEYARKRDMNNLQAEQNADEMKELYQFKVALNTARANLKADERRHRLKMAEEDDALQKARKTSARCEAADKDLAQRDKELEERERAAKQREERIEQAERDASNREFVAKQEVNGAKAASTSQANLRIKELERDVNQLRESLVKSQQGLVAVGEAREESANLRQDLVKSKRETEELQRNGSRLTEEHRQKHDVAREAERGLREEIDELKVSEATAKQLAETTCQELKTLQCSASAKQQRYNEVMEELAKLRVEVKMQQQLRAAKEEELQTVANGASLTSASATAKKQLYNEATEELAKLRVEVKMQQQLRAVKEEEQLKAAKDEAAKDAAALKTEQRLSAAKDEELNRLKASLSEKRDKMAQKEAEDAERLRQELAKCKQEAEESKTAQQRLTQESTAAQAAQSDNQKSLTQELEQLRRTSETLRQSEFELRRHHDEAVQREAASKAACEEWKSELTKLQESSSVQAQTLTQDIERVKSCDEASTAQMKELQAQVKKLQSSVKQVEQELTTERRARADDAQTAMQRNRDLEGTLEAASQTNYGDAARCILRSAFAATSGQPASLAPVQEVWVEDGRISGMPAVRQHMKDLQKCIPSSSSSVTSPAKSSSAPAPAQEASPQKVDAPRSASVQEVAEKASKALLGMYGCYLGEQGDGGDQVEDEFSKRIFEAYLALKDTKGKQTAESKGKVDGLEWVLHLLLSWRIRQNVRNHGRLKSSSKEFKTGLADVIEYHKKRREKSKDHERYWKTLSKCQRVTEQFQQVAFTFVEFMKSWRRLCRLCPQLHKIEDRHVQLMMMGISSGNDEADAKEASQKSNREFGAMFAWCMEPDIFHSEAEADGTPRKKRQKLASP